MTKNTKSLLKHTILGLLAGGSASALYIMNKLKKENEEDAEFRKDEINVPLSRRNFLSAVRPETLSGSARKPAAKPGTPSLEQQADAGSMSPRDLSSLKKELLRKNASGRCSEVKSVDGSASSEFPVRNITGAGSTFRRDKKGRFSSEEKLGKKAGISEDASAVMADNIGMLGGATAGVVLTKLIADKIMINKRKRQVAESRRRYVDALAKEVNDIDLPYYNKTASSNRGVSAAIRLVMNKIAEKRAEARLVNGTRTGVFDEIKDDIKGLNAVQEAMNLDNEKAASDNDRGLVGSALGLARLAGLGMAGAAGLVMYRIMENRRKAEEAAKDKDLQKYPSEKSIRFSFPESEGMK